MKFTVVSAVALLSASAYAASPALVKRMDGCPDLTPWRMGQPNTYWYPICCPYVLADPECCSMDPSKPRPRDDGTPYPPCAKSS